jgi:SAM-dependent methyltransferase
MADRLPLHSTVRTAVIWGHLRAALDELSTTVGKVAEVGGRPLEVLDVGGGSGGFAVLLAELGHRVTVVDASPDSLATLERRATEAAVTDRVHGVQGDATNLLDIAAPASFDAVICHSVLDVVNEPAAALAGTVAMLRPGGLASIVVANMLAVVLHRAIAGRFDEALHALRDPGGRCGPTDPVPRRFSLARLEALAAGAGLTVVATHGARVFVDLVPGGLLDADPGAVRTLLALEAEAADVPALRDVAAQLHVLARRGEPR